MDTVVYNVLCLVTAEAAVATSVHTGQAKSRSGRLIFLVRYVLFPHAPSVIKKESLTSVPTLETCVRKRPNAILYKMDEAYVKKVKKVTVNECHKIRPKTSSTKIKIVQRKAQSRKERSAIFNLETGRHEDTVPTRPPPVTTRQ